MIMNFKDAYKNMNDEIHGDRALLHSILNGEAGKKRKFDFNFKPVFATALTAVFVLCIATVYKNTGIEQYSPSNVKVVTEKENEETVTAKEEKTNESADQYTVSDKLQNSKSEAKAPKKSQTDNQNITGVGSAVERNSDYDEPAAVDESNAPMVASLDETMHAETESAHSGDETFDEAYDSFDSEDVNSAPAPAKAYDISQEKYEESEPEKKSAASGGGASDIMAKSDTVVSRAVIPEDMTFGKAVGNTDGSISYIAVSKDNPDRCLTVIVSGTDGFEAAYPGAHHIHTKNGNIAVIGENMSDDEINKIIDSLSD